MELITHPLTTMVHPILTLPRLVRMVFFVIGGFTAIAIGAWSLGQVAPQPSNPFLEFADFFPGQPATVLQDSQFNCQPLYPYFSLTITQCHFHPSAGTFSGINLTVEYNVIMQINFTLRDTSVRVGDFRGWWDAKPIRTLNDVGFLFLPDYVIIARTTGSSDYSFPFRFVWSVTFAEASAATF